MLNYFFAKKGLSFQKTPKAIYSSIHGDVAE